MWCIMQFKRASLISWFIFYLFTYNLYAQTSITVKGRIFDYETNETLSGAGVEYLDRRTISNTKGEFIALIPLGEEVTLRVSFVGYETKSLTIKCSNDTSISVPMYHNNTISDATITATKNQIKVFHKISAIGFDKSTLHTIPTALGEVDIMKAIQKLPGVIAVGDGRASISVRGGKMDQNQILLNGITLYNAEHLKGFASSINPYMADSLFFYKGGFPAQYGGQLSSIISTEINDGDYYNYHGTISVGVISSTLNLSGPIWKGKTSFNIGARLSYLDLILLPTMRKATKNSNSTHFFTGLQYYDITAKLSHKFSQKDKLSATFYYSHDDQSDYPPPSEYETEKILDEDKKDVILKELSQSDFKIWNNLAGGLLWEHMFSSQIHQETRLNISSYTSVFGNNRSYIETHTIMPDDYISKRGEESSNSQLNSSITEASISNDIIYNISNHSIRAGVKYAINYYNPTIDVDFFLELKKQLHKDEDFRIQSYSKIDTIIGKKYLLNLGSLYLEDTWRIHDKLLGRFGLRHSINNVEKKFYHSLEPRATLIFYPHKSIDIEVSYAKMSQSSHFLSSSNLLTPNDIWVPITDSIPLMKSDIIGAAYRMKFDKGWAFSVEGYYKWMKNLIEYKEGVYVASTTRDWESLVDIGEGRAYGVEVLVEKNIESTTGWASYTWSKSLREFDNLNGGKPFYSNDDRRHNFNITVKHVFNKMFDLSLSWHYQTGARGTIPQYSFLIGSTWQECNPIMKVEFAHRYTLNYKFPSGDFEYYTYHDGYMERNNYKFPDNHRLDLSFNITLNHRKCSSLINLSLYNLYNQPNISYAYLDLDYESKTVFLKGVTLLPFIPSLSYSFIF